MFERRPFTTPRVQVYATETSSGCIVCVNEYLPSGSELAVTVVEDVDAIESRASSTAAGTPVAAKEHEPLLTGALSLPAPPEARPTEASFRAQLLKFERINAHLANERTWLVRWRRMLSDGHSPRRRRGCGRRCRS